MALNLGPEAYEAIGRLKNNADWRIFVQSLQDQMSVMMHRAIEVSWGERVDATGYARGIRDIVTHIELVEQGRGSRTPRIGVKSQQREVA